MEPLLSFTEKGIYCQQADVFLDPWYPVDRAIVTHAHADHATGGHKQYLCTAETGTILSYRLRPYGAVRHVAYGETVSINGVHFALYPAGHISGSAQVRVEYKGEVWVFSGDYKRVADNLATPFEPLRCHAFITESTFGLPVYRWKPQEEIFTEINEWWKSNKSEGRASVIAGYALGKSQRILAHVDHSIGPVFTHGAVDVINERMRQSGLALPPAPRVTDDIPKSVLATALIICPPSAVGSAWLRRFYPWSLGVASGWMKLRGTRRRRGADRGFVLSDHADWDDLNRTVDETGAEKVFVTHGYTEIFTHWLNTRGLEAHEVKTRFEGELSEMAEGSTSDSPL